MKLELFNTEVYKVWSKISGSLTNNPLQLAAEIEHYRKISNFFQVGDFYYLIFNLTYLDLEYVSPHILSVLGYAPEAYTMNTFIDIMHPDDRPWCLAFEQKTLVFLSQLPIELLVKYKVRYDVRLKHIRGHYVRILHQSAVVEHDDTGKIFRTFCVHTDISHLKSEGLPKLSFIGMDGATSFIDVDVQQAISSSQDLLTNREKEILRHIIEGKLSKEIAEELNITVQTVESHRKNMVRKTGLKNSAELIAVAIRKGWI
jgi:DNA-binding CsgD family transcriptional regulator